MSLHRATDGAKSRTNASSRLLWLLIGLALGVSFANLAIGGRHVNFLHQQHQQQPIDQRPKTSKRTQSNSDNNIDNQQVYNGHLITQILNGKKPFPKSNTNNLRLKYKPGTLQITHAQALRHCFANATHYLNHIPDRPQSLVSVSDHYKLIYRNIPKSSSSTARHVVQDFLEGDDARMKHDDMEDKVHNKGYSMISFVREPSNRFYSSYDEAFFRMGPWMGSGPIVRDKPRVRKAYFDNKYKVEKYPYLYEGFTTIDHFRKMYCPEELLAIDRPLDCNLVPSIDDGNLAHRFEQFVRDYSGLDPFDVHLNLQMSNLVFPTGEPFPVTILYNSTEAEKGWQEVAKQRGLTIPDGEMTHGRKITRRFNVSKVSDATKRKICGILALDYCCLNIELPLECRGDDNGEEDEAVYCAMERRNVETMKYALEPLVIHPWRDP